MKSFETIEECKWVQGDEFWDNGCWETDCKNAFCLEYGSPSENDMKYCPYCGKVLIEQKGKTE